MSETNGFEPSFRAYWFPEDGGMQILPPEQASLFEEFAHNGHENGNGGDKQKILGQIAVKSEAHPPEEQTQD